MNQKLLYTAFISGAIALTAIPLQAQENNTVESSDLMFVCAVQEGTPTMFARNPEVETELTPIMSWHSEYLLPEQSGAEVCQSTAAKLHDSYQREQAQYLKSETGDKNNLVCLVDDVDENCITEDSQKLFSVNPNYNAACVLENKQPIECKVLQVRGIYSFDDKPYQTLWWPW